MLKLAPPTPPGPRPLGTPPLSDLPPVTVNSTKKAPSLTHTCSPGHSHSPVGSAAPRASLSLLAHPGFLPSRSQGTAPAAAQALPSSPVAKDSPYLLSVLPSPLPLGQSLGPPPSLGAQQPFHAQTYMVSGALTSSRPRCLSVWLHHLLQPGRGPTAGSAPSPSGHRCVPQASEPGITHSPSTSPVGALSSSS